MDLLLLLLNDEDVINPMLQQLYDLVDGTVCEEFVNADRKKKNRNQHYYEKIIPRYSDKQFKEHFRMTPSTCEKLLNIMGNNIKQPQTYVPLKKKVLFTLWLISKQESFLAVGDRFNIPPSSGHKIFKEIIKILVDLMPMFIVWPDANQRSINANIFHRRFNGFPGVIGAIDGCHISCKQPVNNATDFYNRKGVHSIILQGICDPHCKFIDCFIGLPGRMHDATVFRTSPIYKYLQTEESLLFEHHLVGDSAYPLTPYLLTPYRDTGHLSENQIKYNKRLCATRVVIERAFVLLKCKFRRLK